MSVRLERTGELSAWASCRVLGHVIVRHHHAVAAHINEQTIRKWRAFVFPNRTDVNVL